MSGLAQIVARLRNEFYYRKAILPPTALLDETESLHELLRGLGPKKNLFDRRLFARVRAEVGPQYMWAEAVGVAQGTIGNWERGLTVPKSRVPDCNCRSVPSTTPTLPRANHFRDKKATPAFRGSYRHTATVKALHPQCRPDRL